MLSLFCDFFHPHSRGFLPAPAACSRCSPADWLTMELHLSGERKYLSLASIRAAPPRVISGDESAKLAGCAGAELGPLLPQLAEDETLIGVLVASDGLVSAPITAGELCRGVLLHTDAAGTLLSSLRAWFPPGVAVQPSPCGTHVGPLSLKGACCCVLLPKPVTDALAMSEARLRPPLGHLWPPLGHLSTTSGHLCSPTSPARARPPPLRRLPHKEHNQAARTHVRGRANSDDKDRADGAGLHSVRRRRVAYRRASSAT